VRWRTANWCRNADAAEKADEDERDHAGHHRSGQPKVNVDEADGVNRRHRHSYDGFRREDAPPAGIPPNQRFRAVDNVIASPKLAALVRVTSSTDLVASIYQGFRVPTLNELYRPFRVRNDVTVANESLRPERLTAEAGVHQRWGPADVRITGFWNEVTDQIINVTLETNLPDCRWGPRAASAATSSARASAASRPGSRSGHCPGGGCSPATSTSTPR
jgi:outer membrane receptor protein involved in Fe transport